MNKLYYMIRKRDPSKVEVGTINEEEVILPLVHFVWDAGDQYKWSPEMVVSSTNWGVFNKHPEFIAKLGALSGIVLKPDMLVQKLEAMGCVQVDAADYQDEFIASTIFTDPNLVGSSEYRAIYELIEEADDWAEARSIIEECKEQAEGMLKTLNELGPDE